LDAAPRLSATLSQEVLFKRDDLTGLALGGNKTRMLELLIGQALANGADTVVAGAAAQSNYCRQLAAAAARHGLRTVLVLRSVRGQIDRAVQGNLLLDMLLGAEVTVHEVDVPRQYDLLKETAARLRREGATPYIPQEDAHLGAVAYVDCAIELIMQLEQLPRAPRALYLAAAGETQAGLILGFKALAYPLPVIGVNPGVGWWDVGQRVCDLANRAAASLGLTIEVSRDEIEVLASYGGRGYGLPTDEGVAALKLVAEQEGILLDPVYTSKAMAAVIDLSHSRNLAGEEGAVIFLHTGGAPALFHYHGHLGLASFIRETTLEHEE
jgi:1-aminocyclopropane-1-carboxylate deaminase/D-cysteine desulfhydrase-like pyridoxal-dependent ACC family enzyme